MQCETEKQAEQWRTDIYAALNSPGGLQWTTSNQFLSTFPLRPHSFAQWFTHDKEISWN